VREPELLQSVPKLACPDVANSSLSAALVAASELHFLLLLHCIGRIVVIRARTYAESRLRA
jgi:hypothetical protein